MVGSVDAQVVRAADPKRGIGAAVRWAEAEMKKLVLTAWRNRNVERLIIGNESVLREDVTVKQLIRHILPREAIDHAARWLAERLRADGELRSAAG